jgi:hypothetical protein
LFADILGFASLTEQFPAIRPVNLALYAEWETEKPFDVRYSSLSSQLEGRLVAFHKAVNVILENVAESDYDLISFSDSCYVCLAPHSNHVCRLALLIMRDMIARRIPIRIGIGYGTFVRYRFSTEESPFRKVHEAQFFGTGVVRAYYADANGPKGLRILVHPSAVEVLAKDDQDVLIDLPLAEQSSYARCEVDYSQDLRWDEPDADAKLLGALREMYRTGRRARHHYRGTVAAWQRFKTQKEQDQRPDGAV